MIYPSLKNITEFHPSIQKIIADYANKILVNIDDNLSAILVYGSAAGDHFNPGISNINMAIIVKNLDFPVLKQNVELVKWGHKHKIATPLVLTKEYIVSALDVFPIEFTEIKQVHRLIFGEDVFKELVIPTQDMRLLCEQQVKGKLLHLRQAYLGGVKAISLKTLLGQALSDLLPIFRQLILLKGQALEGSKEEVLASLAQNYSLDSDVFLNVYQDKIKKKTIPPSQVEAHFQNFLSQLEMLSRHLDTL